MVLANKLQDISINTNSDNSAFNLDLFYHFTFWNNLPEEKIALRQDRIHSDSGTHLSVLFEQCNKYDK